MDILSLKPPITCAVSHLKSYATQQSRNFDNHERERGQFPVVTMAKTAKVKKRGTISLVQSSTQWHTS
jgi:hypothetical protein